MNLLYDTKGGDVPYQIAKAFVVFAKINLLNSIRMCVLEVVYMLHFKD